MGLGGAQTQVAVSGAELCSPERTEEAHAEESACRRRDWRRPRVARLARAPERGGGRAGGAGLTRERESEKCKER